MAKATYKTRNRRKYSLKVHIVLVTKYRKPLLKNYIAEDTKQKIYDLCNKLNTGIIAMEADKDHIHIMLEYSTTDRLSDIVKAIKQETTHFLWQKYSSQLSMEYWKKQIFWSDGYFACSVGNASADTIEKYIKSQG